MLKFLAVTTGVALAVSPFKEGPEVDAYEYIDYEEETVSRSVSIEELEKKGLLNSVDNSVDGKVRRFVLEQKKKAIFEKYANLGRPITFEERLEAHKMFNEIDPETHLPIEENTSKMELLKRIHEEYLKLIHEFEILPEHKGTQYADHIGRMKHQAGLWDEAKFGPFEEFVKVQGYDHVFNEAKFNDDLDEVRERFVALEALTKAPGKEREAYLRENNVDIDKFDRRQAPHLFDPETGERYGEPTPHMAPGPKTIARWLEEGIIGKNAKGRRLSFPPNDPDSPWDDWAFPVSAETYGNDTQCHGPFNPTGAFSELANMTDCAKPFSFWITKHAIGPVDFHKRFYYANWSPCLWPSCEADSANFPSCYYTTEETWWRTYMFCPRYNLHHMDGLADYFYNPTSLKPWEAGSAIVTCQAGHQYPSMKFKGRCTGTGNVPNRYAASSSVISTNITTSCTAQTVTATPGTGWTHPSYCLCDSWQIDYGFHDWVPHAYYRAYNYSHPGTGNTNPAHTTCQL